MQNKEILERAPWNFIGIEVEYTDIVVPNHTNLMDLLNRHMVQIVHDASVESPSNSLGGVPVKGTLLDSALNSALIEKCTIGGELVTRIIDSSSMDYLRYMDSIFDELKSCGERSKTTRGSIHIHVNFPKDLKTRHSIGLLRRAWILAGYFESAFFKIGSYGRDHRGKNMDFIYYRPITGFGPPIIGSGGKNRPVLIYDDVLSSKSYREFMIKCADIYNAQSRYHPSRYMWINFYNIHFGDRPHIEFRVFNKVLRWDYLYATVELCKAFAKACYAKTTKEIESFTKLEQIRCGEFPPDDDKYYSELVEFLDITDGRVLEILRDIWNKSNYVEFINDRVYSHLRNDNSRRMFTNTDYAEYFPATINEVEMRKVRNPKFVDIHLLKQLGETVFPEEVQ